LSPHELERSLKEDAPLLSLPMEKVVEKGMKYIAVFAEVGPLIRKQR